MNNDKMLPIYPGEVLLEEFIVPLGSTRHRTAVDIGVPPRRINEIVHGNVGPNLRTFQVTGTP